MYCSWWTIRAAGLGESKKGPKRMLKCWTVSRQVIFVTFVILATIFPFDQTNRCDCCYTYGFFLVGVFTLLRTLFLCTESLCLVRSVYPAINPFSPGKQVSYFNGFWSCKMFEWRVTLKSAMFSFLGVYCVQTFDSAYIRCGTKRVTSRVFKGVFRTNVWKSTAL